MAKAAQTQEQNENLDPQGVHLSYFWNPGHCRNCATGSS